MVDHVVPISQGGARTEESNLQTMCDRCHAKKRQGEVSVGKFKCRVVVVCGPAGSGKTTYVRERFARGDLVLDLDLVIGALLGGVGRTEKDEYVVPFACEARDAVVKRLERESEVKTAWVVTGGAEREKRQWFERRGARVVVLAVEEEECMRRIRNDLDKLSRRGEEEMWNRVVEKWWAEYQE